MRRTPRRYASSVPRGMPSSSDMRVIVRRGRLERAAHEVHDRIALVALATAGRVGLRHDGQRMAGEWGARPSGGIGAGAAPGGTPDGARAGRGHGEIRHWREGLRRSRTPAEDGSGEGTVHADLPGTRPRCAGPT
jgi:hypothetical protein